MFIKSLDEVVLTDSGLLLCCFLGGGALDGKKDTSWRKLSGGLGGGEGGAGQIHYEPKFVIL